MINNEEFVKLWMEAYKARRSREWLRERLGYTDVTIVSNKATYLRKKGVDLPILSHNNGSTPGVSKDYSKLNEIVKEADHA